MAITVTGKLKYGYKDDAGVVHKDYEMRMATLEDTEVAIEQTPENACSARMSRHIWAQTLVSLGTVPAEEITPELLAGLHFSEYDILSASTKELEGKLTPASAD